MDGVFITATDTEVGKTTLSAGLLKLIYGSRPVAYWKPIQTGTIIGDDTTDVRRMTELGTEAFLEPLYRYPEPAAPYLASKNFGKGVDVESIIEFSEQCKREGKFLIVEGGGGVLVPLNEQVLQLELIKRLKFPVIIVAEDKLGTINQTLLSIRACRDEGIDILGVVLTKSQGARAKGNADCIARFGNVEILAEFPKVSDTRSMISQVSGSNRLRNLFHVSPIPN